ncbi:MAG TPA: DUF3344 domain-containing protein [Methanoregulaceae archaeon]|nr:MAG: DUF3344 domain-containing protein [Methanolinea sp.]HON82239.1 DUF3344 domain-containing protein [Methanoregulaceae archaeon]HPD10988.1 DUF3344 domain-containing protein [Methanoregulaceae archaeon]HRT15199.1 DUF3344 domain-containing protein [Methanoregulaceae archaeon]HRU30684.1 DUF3344 domain-containing protein [Methanoregulaceae archaeon]
MEQTRTNEWDGRSIRILASAMLIALFTVVVAASADPYVGGMPLETVQTGVVSGDLFMDATVPSFGQATVTKSFLLPEYSRIQWARLYVVVYCGHMQNNYNGTVRVSFDGNGDGTYETVLGTETLDVPFTYLVDGGPGYVVVNSQTTRVTSDYLMWYDVANRISSRKPGVRVEVAKLNPSFDGRIKAVTLVVAYDDGDDDQVWYAVNQGHDTDTYYSDDILGEDYRGETSFDTSGVSGPIEKATLYVNHLSSQDGFYRFNGEDLEGGQNQGAYFGSNRWDVTGEVRGDGENLLTYDRAGGTGPGFGGQFYKIIIASLTIRQGNEPEEPPEEEPTLPPAAGTAPGDPGTGEVVADGKGYFGRTIPVSLTGMVNGSVQVIETSDYSGLIPVGDSKNYTLRVPLATGDAVRLARLYTYTTWGHDEKRREGRAAPLTLQYGSSTVPPVAQYSDRKGFGIYDYPVETFVYDVHEILDSGGNYTFSVGNTGKGNEAFAVYGLLLVLATEIEGGTPTRYWIAEGSDVLLAGTEFQTSSEDATTVFPFEAVPAALSAARLYLISTAASGEPDDENRITFNEAEWDNLLVNGSAATSIAMVDVLESIRPGFNEATIQSHLTLKRGDYLENRGAVLVVEPDDGQPASIPVTRQDTVRVTRTVAPADVTPAPAGGEERPGFFQYLFRLIFAPVMPATTAPAAGERPPVAALSSQVDLTIFTDPEGARVKVNGVEQDDLTPVIVAVPRNETQEVVVMLDGYDPYRTAIIPATDSDLHIVFTSFVPPYIPVQEPGLSHAGHLGGVYVTSYPSEATIIIDGRKTDKVTPSVMYGLREGYHTVGVEKKNMVFPAPLRVAVSPGTIIPVSFMEGPGYSRMVTVESDTYAGASFTVNGRGPVREIPDEVGIEGTPAYIVIFSEGSFISRVIPPFLESGGSLLIRPSPQDREALSVVVTSEPNGAAIFFDGFSTGSTTPAVIENVSPGLHRVMVQAPGYLPGERDLMVTDIIADLIDERVFIRLEEYPHGSLNLTSSPPGARVYLSGRNTGERTPVTITSLPIGFYSVRLVGADVSRTYDVVMGAGEEKRVHAVFPE